MPGRRNPLAAWVFPARNLSKSLPLVLVIVLAVLLIAGIVATINSIPLSVRTTYGYSRFLTGATARGDMRFLPKLREHFKRSPVPIERTVNCRTALFNIRSIVGSWPFLMNGLSSADARYVTRKMGFGPLNGRYPLPGAPEAAITEPVARNLGLKLGDALLKPGDDKNYSPYPVRIVGIFDSKEWFAFSSYEYIAANHFPPIDVLLLFAKNQIDQRKLDRWSEQSLKGQKALVFSFPTLQEDTENDFRVLFKILNLVIGLLVVVISLMMGMLINIYLSQRIIEFGLLQAIGFTKKALVLRGMAESVIVVVLGWLLGVLCAISLLYTIKRALMDPRAYALDPFDSSAYSYTLAIPVVIIVAALLTVVYRFSKFDPIAVVERRIL